MQLRLADDQERLSEDGEVPDDREAREDQQHRLEDRERDVEEHAPRARAVDLGRLDELVGHLRERGVDVVIVTKGIAPHTITAVTTLSCENVVAYQSWW